ncbi:MAG: hypothetical protein PHQ75_01845 [Thermoguttaceae bacterium]|nr:hypothetical protein [Thermoguttaceae bacterium]
MKHDRKRRRGAVIIIALVVVMLLATLSAFSLKHFAREHKQYDKRVCDIQSELLREAMSRDDFLKRFDGQKQVLMASFNEPGPNPSTRYVLRVDPLSQPAAASLQIQKIPRRINHHDN